MSCTLYDSQWTGVEKLLQQHGRCSFLYAEMSGEQNFSVAGEQGQHSSFITLVCEQ
jgi:hypothetical protein